MIEQSAGIIQVALVRWINERKVGWITQAQIGHLQQHRGQVGAQNFCFGIARPGFELVGIVQAHANPGGGASAASFALIGVGLGDRFDLQILDFAAWVIARDAGQTGIDDMTDAGHCQ